MKILKRTVSLCAALLILTGVGAMADNGGITVRLNGIADASTREAQFGEYAPIQINDRTYVHSRCLAEAAGMKVGWDQENLTAFIKIFADADSQSPLERYAARQFELLSDRAPGAPSNITISLMIDNANALLRYNYDIGNGNVAGLGKSVEMDGAATTIEYGALMVPLRSVMELIGLDVYWDQESMTIDLWIPDKTEIPDGLEATDIWIPENEYYTGNNPPDYIPDGVHEIGEYLGSFRVTKYCPCNICNGGWGPYTAWAGGIVPGRTVAVHPGVIPKLAWVYIDGYGWRRAEDTGGGVARNQIDLAVATHYEATHGNVLYHDVWLAK